jgi:hypothetical protein
MNIKGVPAFMFFKNGHLFETMVGSDLKKEEIREKTEELIHWDLT